ncbi:MAG: hypothetical protein R3C45_13050 [Phycisphaerales bacterium]
MPVYIEPRPAGQGSAKINGLRAVFGEVPAGRAVRVDRRARERPDRQAEQQGWSRVQHRVLRQLPHLAKTGDAEGFCIVSQDAVSKACGVLQLTGSEALELTAEGDRLVHYVPSRY